MSTVLNFKDIVDLPKWRPLATPIGIGRSGQTVFISDPRNNEDRHPFIYIMPGNSIYNVKNDEWEQLTSLGLATAVSSAVFMSGQGPRGTIAAGATTTSIPLTTALPATVGVNQLANRGDGRGFKVRIIGNAAGSSGKTEERYIVGNTGQTTTPILTLDSPLSFVPILGDAYEFLSGRIFVLGTTNAAGSWKYYDVLTGSNSGNLSTTNLPASIPDSSLVGLDELYVPYDRNPGEGFFGNLVATATGAASLTGQAAGGDAGVLTNEHRNFQIRIVQDIATPTAVGQRRNITTHTGGPSPVYTVSVWSVQPSATATYVIENNGDRIICWPTNAGAGNPGTITYTISTNSWDIPGTIFTNRPNLPQNGCTSFQSYGIELDPAKNARHSFIFSWRSGNTLDLFDIAGSSTGTWTQGITYANIPINLPSFSQGYGATYDPATMQGRYMYIMATAVGAITSIRTYRFDLKNRVLEPQTLLKPSLAVNDSGTNCKYMAQTVYVDGNTKLSFIIILAISTSQFVPASYTFGLPITR